MLFEGNGNEFFADDRNDAIRTHRTAAFGTETNSQDLPTKKPCSLKEAGLEKFLSDSLYAPAWIAA